MDVLPTSPAPASGGAAAAGGHASSPPRNTAVLSAVGVAALAALLYAFPGNWSALWRGAEVPAGQVSGVPAAAPGDAAGTLYADLERHLRWQPTDARALVFKARLDMRAQRYEQAAAAYEKAVAGNSKAALDPAIWVEYAEARGMAQGRTLAGEPLKLVHKALALDANHAQALDLAGSAAWEAGDFGGAALYWKRLLAQIPADSAMHAELSRAIERAGQRARLSLPPAAGEPPGAQASPSHPRH